MVRLLRRRSADSTSDSTFDLRTFRLNDEASLNGYDRGFATEMTPMFEQDLEHGLRDDDERWRRRPLKKELFETVVLPIKSRL